LDKEKKARMIHELLLFAPYFVIVLIISMHGGISRQVAGDEIHTKFFMSLMFLHLVSWIFIYAVARTLVLLMRSSKK